jgi:hypothetical protein
MTKPQNLYAIVYITDTQFDGHVATRNGKYRVYTDVNRAKTELKKQLQNMHRLDDLKLVEYIPNREIDGE